MANDIKKFIYNPRQGLVSEDKLFKKLKSEGYNVTKNELKNIIKDQFFYQVTKPQRKPHKFNIIWSPYVGYNVQMDIMVYDRYEFHNYKYILCIIDVHSRYALCRGMTNREDKTILDKMKSIFDEFEFIPKTINCDLEFDTKNIKQWATDNDVKFFFSEAYDTIKNGIVERFNGTLASLLQKYRIASKKYDWNKYLDDIVYNYNHTYHSTIKAIPADVFDGKDINHQKFQKKIENKFHIGDKVRIKHKKTVFTKGDATTYSDDIYIIDDIDKNKIYLIGEERSYQPHQLTLANAIYYNDDDQDEIEEITFKKERAKRNQTKKLQKEDLNENNIIETKRNRKKKQDNDYIY